MQRHKPISLTKKHLEASEQRIHSSITDLARHMTLSFGQERQYVDGKFSQIDQQFAEVNTKLDAIMDAVATRKEMHNLVRELKTKGIALNEAKIFVSW